MAPLLVDPPPLNFLSLTLNNHILGGSASDALWQLYHEAADGYVIVKEWKNPESFYGSLCMPQPSAITRYITLASLKAATASIRFTLDFR